jgi:hypothetical protein
VIKKAALWGIVRGAKRLRLAMARAAALCYNARPSHSDPLDPPPWPAVAVAAPPVGTNRQQRATAKTADTWRRLFVVASPLPSCRPYARAMMGRRGRWGSGRVHLTCRAQVPRAAARRGRGARPNSRPSTSRLRVAVCAVCRSELSFTFSDGMGPTQCCSFKPRKQLKLNLIYVPSGA